MNELLFDEDARKKLQEGVNTVAKIVKCTYGPNGNNVTWSTGYNTKPFVSRDGVSVALQVAVDDEVANVGVVFMQGVAFETVSMAGDGTSLSTILAQSLVNGGLKMVTAGAKPIELKRGMDKGVKAVVDKIKELSVQVSKDENSLLNIATISANNDPSIGGLIAEAFKKMGNTGKLKIEESQTAETTIKVVSGYEIQRGMVTPQLTFDAERMETIFNKPLILLADYSVNFMKDVQELLGEAVKTGRPIVIIASDYGDGGVNEVLNTFVINKNQNGLMVCAVQLPPTYKQETLSDIAVLIGATVIADENGLKLENAKVSHMGTCDKIIINQRTTTIIGGAGDKAVVSARKKELEMRVENEKIKEVKEVEENRLAVFCGSTGVIYVGASSEVEMKEKKDRVDDAVRAVKSAIAEGIVPGGGVCLLRCIEALDSIECLSGEEILGVDVIRKCLDAPIKQLLENSGCDDISMVVTKVKSGAFDYGYNAKTMRFENLLETGVVDAAKVIRCALESANSVAGMIILTKVLMVKTNPKK